MVVLLLGLPIGSAFHLAQILLGVLFVIFVADALIHYNRGDLYDGHSHFRKLLTGALVCLVLLGAISGYASIVKDAQPVRSAAVGGLGGDSSFGGGVGFSSGGKGGGGR